jgi:hypothetical protein
MATPVSLYRQLPSLRQRARRVAVIAAFGGYPLVQLGYFFLVAPGYLSTTIWAPIAVILFSATLVGVVATYGFSQGRIDRRRGLDERQRAMVERSLIASYGVVTAVLALTLTAATLMVVFVRPFTVDMALLFPIIVGFALYEPLVPFAAYAWIETDPPLDDEA